MIQHLHHFTIKEGVGVYNANCATRCLVGRDIEMRQPLKLVLTQSPLYRRVGGNIMVEHVWVRVNNLCVPVAVRYCAPNTSSEYGLFVCGINFLFRSGVVDGPAHTAMRTPVQHLLTWVRNLIDLDAADHEAGDAVLVAQICDAASMHRALAIAPLNSDINGDYVTWLLDTVNDHTSYYDMMELMGEYMMSSKEAHRLMPPDRFDLVTAVHNMILDNSMDLYQDDSLTRIIMGLHPNQPWVHYKQLIRMTTKVPLEMLDGVWDGGGLPQGQHGLSPLSNSLIESLLLEQDRNVRLTCERKGNTWKVEASADGDFGTKSWSDMNIKLRPDGSLPPMTEYDLPVFGFPMRPKVLENLLRVCESCPKHDIDPDYLEVEYRFPVGIWVKSRSNDNQQAVLLLELPLVPYLMSSPVMINQGCDYCFD